MASAVELLELRERPGALSEYLRRAWTSERSLVVTVEGEPHLVVESVEDLEFLYALLDSRR